MWIGQRTGKNTWVAMGPLGWLVVGFVWLILVLVAGFWPLMLLIGLFPHQLWAEVVGWILTGIWWTLWLLGFAMQKGWLDGKPTEVPPSVPTRTRPLTDAERDYIKRRHG